ncbi:MAG TPA: hypothetical protein VFG68_16330 [Fimbriiglobus sp.]|nr:hypothetical protein [Fimbriiglobus sp.]
MNRRRVIHPDNADYLRGEPLDISPEDDRVPYTDTPPPVELTPAGPTAVPLEPLPVDDRTAPPSC